MKHIPFFTWQNLRFASFAEARLMHRNPNQMPRHILSDDISGAPNLSKAHESSKYFAEPIPEESLDEETKKRMKEAKQAAPSIDKYLEFNYDMKELKAAGVEKGYAGTIDRNKLQEIGIDLDKYLSYAQKAKHPAGRIERAAMRDMERRAVEAGMHLPDVHLLKKNIIAEHVYWEVLRPSETRPGYLEWTPLEPEALQKEIDAYEQRTLEEQELRKQAALAERARFAAEQAQLNDPGYGTLDIPYAEGSIIISVSPGLADTSSALQNVPGTQGANRKGLSPSIMLENRRIGLNPFYTDVRHRSTAEQSSVHRDAETQARALEQLGIRLIQTEDGTRFKVVRPLPEGEWITINGHRISGHETQAIARQREWEAKMKLLFERKEEQEGRLKVLVERFDAVLKLTKRIALDGTDVEKSEIPVIEKEHKEKGTAFLKSWKEAQWPITADLSKVEKTLTDREKILADMSAAASHLELRVQPYLDRQKLEAAQEQERARQEREAAAQRAREAQEVRANVAPLFAPISKRVQKADGFKEEPVVEVLEDRTATMTLTGPAGRSVRIVAEPQAPDGPPVDVRPFKTDPESKAEQVAFRKEFPMPNGDIVSVESEEVETVDATGVRLKLQVGAKKEEILLLSRKISDTAFAIDIFENGARRTVRVEGDEPVVRSLFDQINLRRATERRKAVAPKTAPASAPGSTTAAPASFPGSEFLPAWLRSFIPSVGKPSAAPAAEKGKVSPEVQRQIDLKKRFAAVIADPSLAGKAEFIDQGDANWSGRSVDKYLVRIGDTEFAHVYIGGKEKETVYVIDPLTNVGIPGIDINASGNIEVSDGDDADSKLKSALEKLVTIETAASTDERIKLFFGEGASVSDGVLTLAPGVKQSIDGDGPILLPEGITEIRGNLGLSDHNGFVFPKSLTKIDGDLVIDYNGYAQAPTFASPVEITGNVRFDNIYNASISLEYTTRFLDSLQKQNVKVNGKIYLKMNNSSDDPSKVSTLSNWVQLPVLQKRYPKYTFDTFESYVVR